MGLASEVSGVRYAYKPLSVFGRCTLIAHWGARVEPVAYAAYAHAACAYVVVVGPSAWRLSVCNCMQDEVVWGTS